MHANHRMLLDCAGLSGMLLSNKIRKFRVPV